MTVNGNLFVESPGYAIKTFFLKSIIVAKLRVISNLNITRPSMKFLDRTY